MIDDIYFYQLRERVKLAPIEGPYNVYVKYNDNHSKQHSYHRDDTYQELKELHQIYRH